MALIIEIGELSEVEEELASVGDYGLGEVGAEWKRSVSDALETAREGAFQVAEAADTEERATTLDDLDKALGQADSALSTVASSILMTRASERDAYSSARKLVTAAEIRGIASPGFMARVRGALSAVKKQCSKIRAGATKIASRVYSSARSVASKAATTAKKYAARAWDTAKRAAAAAKVRATAAARAAKARAAAIAKRATELASRAVRSAKATAKAVGRKVIDAAKRAVSWAKGTAKAAVETAKAAAVKALPVVAPVLFSKTFRDAWNKMVDKMREAAAAVTGLKAARAGAEGKIKLLNNIAPRIIDPAWQANYSRILTDYNAVSRDTDKKLAEYSSQTKQANTELAEAKEKEAGKVGEIGLAWFAWAGIFAALAAAFFFLVQRWKTISTNAELALRAAEDQGLITQTEAAYCEANLKRRDDISKELDATRRNLELAEKEYADCKARGDEEGAAAALARINADRAKIDMLSKELAAPIPAPTWPVAPTPVPEKPPEEKTLLEKWFGISPGMIGVGLFLILGIMLAPRIIETVKAIKKK